MIIKVLCLLLLAMEDKGAWTKCSPQSMGNNHWKKVKRKAENKLKASVGMVENLDITLDSFPVVEQQSFSSVQKVIHADKIDCIVCRL